MADNYDDYSRDQLIRLLRERDRKPKFGLVWERDEIEHDKAVNEDFVALDFIPGLSCPAVAVDSSAEMPGNLGKQPYRNLIIEGDNFDALRFLRMTHAGKVKCIYIDPPYNTGNRDFIYNDRFIDKDDVYKHSKWLEFMYRRLELAKELLAEDGVIFVSIDDNEAFHLALLMEKIFGIQNFIGCFIWRKVDSPNDNKVALTPDHEFVFCYAQNGSQVKLSPMAAPGIVEAYGRIDEDGRRYRDRLLKKNGKNSLRRDRPTMFFPITDPEGNEVYPIHDNGEEARWAMGKDGIAKHRGSGTLIWKQREKLSKIVWEPYTREFSPETPVRPYPTIWSDLPTMRQAKAMLRDIFDTSDLFSTPKPVELIQRILLIINDPSALVLDFFAGSGTTAHAVQKLNQEDGGNRRFILVSSTEAVEEQIPPGPPFSKRGTESEEESNIEGEAAAFLPSSQEGRRLSPPFAKGGAGGISDKNLCRDICAERMRRVIRGYDNKKGEAVAGLGGDFAYLRTRRIPAEAVLSRIEHEQVWTALQLIHTQTLQPYAFGAALQTAEWADGKLIYCPKISEDTPEQLLALAAGQAETVVYSWQPGWLRQYLPDDGIAIEQIPAFLINRFGGNHAA